MGMIDQELLERIVCPDDKQALLVKDEHSLQCTSCKRIYPIEDGIPNLLPQTSGSKG